MDNSGQQELLLKWLRETAEKGQGFIESEAPQYAAELISWCWWSSLVFLVVGAAALVLGVVAAVVWLRNVPKMSGCGAPSNGHDAICIASTITFFVCAVIAVVFGFGGGCNLVKVSVAPRVVLVEQVAKMLKQDK